METQTDHEEGFRRQRRNLIAMSMFIILFRGLELNAKELNFFGNIVVIGQPGMITAFIFLIFLYYIWRYTAYLNSLPSTSGIINVRYTVNNIIRRRWELLVISMLADNSNFQKRAEYMGLSLEPSRPSLFCPKETSVTYFLPSSATKTDSISKTPFIKVLILKMKSCLEASIHHHGVSEYIFPYILAFFASLELVRFGPIIPLIKFILDTKNGV